MWPTLPVIAQQDRLHTLGPMFPGVGLDLSQQGLSTHLITTVQADTDASKWAGAPTAYSWRG